ncbi:hypothetical protein ACFY3G_29130 [Streptomyces phaeochromogenes]|uniref:hypothetical protein n=1 Tax=Streptomyces phaeochromogenes TaxID=1923 RepID=UPI0036AEF42A
MNPRGHADGDYMHEDIAILDFVKGPPGAPFLRRDIVHILRRLERWNPAAIRWRIYGRTTGRDRVPDMRPGPGGSVIPDM